MPPVPSIQTPDDNSSNRQADLFHRAHVRNHGGVINTTIANAVYYYDNAAHSELTGREKLRPLFIMDATHNGHIRVDALGCHPETCQAIILDIVSWVEHTERERNLLLLYGPAGIGKSAIAKSTANKLDETDSKAKVAASFFFWKGDPTRSDLSYVAPTLSYQLTLFNKELRKQIDEIIEKDPSVLNAEIEVQWRKLFIQPVRAISDLPPALVIIDGLDECGTPKDQRKLLELIAACGSNFPLAFLVACRPEPHIMNAFKSEPLFPLCRQSINLAQCRDDNEMQTFIRSRFSVIYDQYRDVLEEYSTKDAWPSPDVIQDIIDKAQGQYLYPVTLFKYLEQEDIDQHERLQEFIGKAPGTSAPLDHLYTQILRASHSSADEQMQDLLFVVASGLDFNPGVTIPTLAALLGFSVPQINLRLRKLYSVLDLPINRNPEAWVGCYHRTFSDFLFDPLRSGDYYIEKKSHAIRVIKRCLLVLGEGNCNDETFVSLMVIWWACSELLSRVDVPDELIERMGGFNVYGPLETVRLGHFQKAAYSTFARTCKNWSIPLLMNKFDGDMDKIVKVAQWLKLHFLCLWKGCQSCFGSRNKDSSWTDGKQLDRSDIHEYSNAHIGTSPLSWLALIALAKAFRDLWGLKRGSFVVLTRDKFVQLSLKVLCSEDLTRMLYDDDRQFLSTWSRAWDAYPPHPKLDKLWIRVHNSVQSGMLQQRSLETPSTEVLVTLVRQLPKEYHNHSLNGDKFLAWLDSNFSPSEYRDLRDHWNGGECFSDSGNQGQAGELLKRKNESVEAVVLDKGKDNDGPPESKRRK
ncbi:hypothetical protein AX16_008627 [Volvariella volvacea WC 439]|nr:hypothetical protein AX16_008627 [Volvariella volvacea WC 439]